MNSNTEPAASVSPQTINTPFDKDTWRKQQADRAEKFHSRLVLLCHKNCGKQPIPDSFHGGGDGSERCGVAFC